MQGYDNLMAKPTSRLRVFASSRLRGNKGFNVKQQN